MRLLISQASSRSSLAVEMTNNLLLLHLNLLSMLAVLSKVQLMESRLLAQKVKLMQFYRSSDTHKSRCVIQ